MAQPAFDPETAAAEIAAAREAGARLVPFSDRFSGLGLDEAYRAAGIVACRRAARSPVVGRKIGFTNRALWEAAGLDRPVWGSMYRETVSRADARDAGRAGESLRLAMAGAVEPRIECEVVAVLASPVRAGERGAAVARRVALVGLGFEVVDSPYPDWRMRPADAVAAGGIHHALAAGALQPVGDPEDTAAMLGALAVTVERNGEPAAEGAGRMVLGNPLDAIGVLAEITATQGQPLQAGEIITTGTLTPPLPCQSGETWRGVAAGEALAAVTVDLV